MKKVLLIIAAVIGIAAIGYGIYFGGGELGEEEIQREYAEGRFADGIMLNGVDIGGMTMAEAQETAARIEAELLDDTILALKIGESSYTLTHEAFNVTFDTQEVLKSAMLAGKGGSIYSRQNFARSGEKRFFIEKTVTGLKDVSALAELAQEKSSAPKDAAMEFTPGGDQKFSYTEGQAGIAIDEEQLEQAVNEALAKGELTVEVPFTETQPRTTVESLKGSVVRRAYFETSYASAPYNDEDRVHNIEKCVSIINGKKLVLAPGESLSLNKVLGDRTEAGGWKLAPGYVSGRTEDQAGGGVCQISSTLYCAALKADLTIIKRQNHTIPVGYVAQGLDATISTGGPDLVIRNDTSSNVYICCGLSGKQSVYFEVYGEPFEGFTKILINSKKESDIEPDGDMVYTYTDELDPGEEEVYVKRRSGSVYSAYKSYYNGDELIKTVEIASSKYPAYSGETRIGK